MKNSSCHRLHRLGRLLFCLCMMALMLITTSCNNSAEDVTKDEHGKKFIVLATSDIHGNIWGYSYEDNIETTNNGMARLYTYIQKVRDEEPTVFLI